MTPHRGNIRILGAFAITFKESWAMSNITVI